MMGRMPDLNEPRTKPRTASNRIASQVNRTVLLDALRSQGPSSLADLAKVTGLSIATVNRLVDRLIDDDEIVTTRVASSTGGRPARIVEFNPAAGSVLAVDLGGRRITAAVTDLHASVLLREEVSIASADRSAARDVYESLVTVVQQLLDDAAAAHTRVRAVCVGVPGVVRSGAGRVEFAPALQWFDFPLVDLLQDHLGIAVHIENDVNLTALAELRHGAARGCNDVLVVSVGTGVGAALLLDGRLYRGASGAAGEVGYTMLDRSSLASPWPGFGDLESRVGTAGVLERLGGTTTAMEGMVPFLDAARAGDATATAVFDELVDDLTLLIANASVLVNPELVVLGGGFGRAAADLLLPAVERRLTGRIPFEPALVRAELDDAELIGAAELAIDASRQSAALAE